MVEWPSGLGGALQKHLHRFKSCLNLKTGSLEVWLSLVLFLSLGIRLKGMNEEIMFTEPQLRVVNSLKNQYVIKGIYIGVGLVAAAVAGITLSVCLINKYSHLIY